MQEHRASSSSTSRLGPRVGHWTVTPSVRAPANRDIVVDRQIVKAPSGQPLRVNVDPFELSPDGAWLYYGPLEGPWSRIATRLLNNPNVNGDELTRNVEPWADLPPVGGTVMGPSGDLYFTAWPQTPSSDALRMARSQHSSPIPACTGSTRRFSVATEPCGSSSADGSGRPVQWRCVQNRASREANAYSGPLMGCRWPFARQSTPI